MAKSAFVLLLAFACQAIGNPLDLNKRAACNGDNCARQVTGTSTLPSQPPRTQRASDCASFLLTTVTPAPVVSTVTSTLIAGRPTPVQAALVTTAQTVSPSTVPTYITMCGSGPTETSRYSSACACFTGVTKSITTTNTPTVTTTVYTACSTIVLQATDGPYAGAYFKTHVNGQQLLANTAVSEATLFVYQNGMLYQQGSSTALLDAVFDGTGPLYLDDVYGGASGYTPLVCTIGASGAISCQSQGGTSDTFQYYARDVYFCTGAQSGLPAFVPKALPMCAA